MPKVPHRSLMILLGLLVAMLALAVEVRAQSHEGYIYGKVTTNRATYTGPIRWGTEEVLWTDIFNAAKTDNSYERLVPEQKDNKDSWFDYNWNFSSIWENSTIHQFNCQFGNMSAMVIDNHGDVILKLKNGGEIKVDDNGNDIGESIQVIDPDLGAIKIPWDNLERIEFLPTLKKLTSTFGVPLFGTVEGVRKEKFKGFIVWDNDERLTTDMLDGDTEDGDVSFRFGDLVSIEKKGSGSLVVLKSGREVFLDGSNDVNSENRGVLVVSLDVGVIDFSWDAFRKITFTAPDNTGPSYAQFTAPKFMTGTVSRLDGEDVTGRIIYDTDEALDFEIVEGHENDIEYHIPLKNIKSITPKNYDYSLVELTSGLTLLLGEGRDVSSRNSGLLIFIKGKRDPTYVPWKQINQINFN